MSFFLFCKVNKRRYRQASFSCVFGNNNPRPNRLCVWRGRIATEKRTSTITAFKKSDKKGPEVYVDVTFFFVNGNLLVDRGKAAVAAAATLLLLLGGQTSRGGWPTT